MSAPCHRIMHQVAQVPSFWGSQNLYFPSLRYSTLKNETLVILLTNSVTQIWLGVHVHQTIRQLRLKLECTNILKASSQPRSSRETLKPQSFFFQAFPNQSFRIFPILKPESSESCTSRFSNSEFLFFLHTQIRKLGVGKLES